MPLSRFPTVAAALFCALSVVPAVHAAHGGEKMRVALVPVTAAPSAPAEDWIAKIAGAMQSAEPETPEQTDRVARRIEEQLLNSGFFDVVDRSEASLAAALEEIQFIDNFSFQTGDGASRPEFGNIADVRYLVFVALEQSEYQSVPRARYRAVRVPEEETTRYTLGLRILDAESMRIAYARTEEYLYDGKDPVNDLARDAVTRIVDALYPFRIIARAGERLYFNRGTETNTNPGDRLELFRETPVADSATGNVLAVETPLAEVVVDRAQAWVCEAVLSDPALMANVSEATRARHIATAPPPPAIPTPKAPALDW